MNPKVDYGKVVGALADAVKELNVRVADPSERYTAELAEERSAAASAGQLNAIRTSKTKKQLLNIGTLGQIDHGQRVSPHSTAFFSML